MLKLSDVVGCDRNDNPALIAEVDRFPKEVSQLRMNAVSRPAPEALDFWGRHRGTAIP